MNDEYSATFTPNLFIFYLFYYLLSSFYIFKKLTYLPIFINEIVNIIIKKRHIDKKNACESSPGQLFFVCLPIY